MSTQSRLLVIDDNVVDLKLTSLMLEKNNFKIFTSTTAVNAMEIIANEKINAGIFKLEQLGAKVEADYFNNKFKEKDLIEEKRKTNLSLSLKKNQNLLYIGLGLFALGLLLTLWQDHEDLYGDDYATVKYPFMVFLLITTGIIIVFIGLRKYLKIKKELNK